MVQKNVTRHHQLYVPCAPTNSSNSNGSPELVFLNDFQTSSDDKQATAQTFTGQGVIDRSIGEMTVQEAFNRIAEGVLKREEFERWFQNSLKDRKRFKKNKQMTLLRYLQLKSIKNQHLLTAKKDLK